jgi:hypothetical protein
MKTEFSYYMGLVIFTALVVINVFDIMKAETLGLEAIISYAMIVVFGVFDLLIIFLIVQTKRKIAYIEFTERTLILHNLLGRTVEARLKGKIEYRKRKASLQYIYMYDRDKRPKIILSDSYEIPLVDIQKRIELQVLQNKKM